MPLQRYPGRLHLMQITHDLDIGGLQQVVLNLCRTINRDRFDISVLCLRNKGYFAEDIEKLGIPVYSLEQDIHGVDYVAFFKIAKLLRELKVDVIHTHNTQPFFDGTIAALLAGVRTVVHTDHARMFPDKRRYMFAEWLMSQFAYKVVGCSEHTAAQLRQYEKISAKKLTVIPNGIDSSRFAVTVDKPALRHELGIRKNGAIIGLAARLSEEKGITFLLQAMPQVLLRHPDTTLLVIGDGDKRDVLQAETTALGLTADVIFTGARKDVPQLLQLLDIYTLPSKREGLPMAILEAMAASRPVVATDVGGNASAVIQNQTGLLVPPQQPALLADAIIQLLDQPELGKQFAAHGLQRFMELFSADKMARQYEKLYLRQQNPG